MVVNLRSVDHFVIIAQWSPCHSVVAVPLLIAFELLLCCYLDTQEGNLPWWHTHLDYIS